MGNENFYSNLVENLFEGIYYVDKDLKIILWNKRAEQITGYSKEEVIGTLCSDNILRHLDEFNCEVCLNGCPLKKTLLDGELREADLYLHHKEGHRVPVKIRISPIYDDSNSIVGAVEIFFDRSNTKNIVDHYESIDSVVYRDEITDTGNSLMYERYLAKAIKSLDQFGIGYAILAIDIDDLGLVNEKYGNDFGNKAIIMVAKTLNNLIRDFDVAFRIDGGTFIVIIENILPKEIEAIAERIRFFTEKSWMSLKESNIFFLTVSIGATMLLITDDEDGVKARVKELLIQSKTNGKNMVTIG